MIRAIIFDFDGVILESAEIKTQTFGDIVNEYPANIRKMFVDYHMQNMGISRYVKFEYFFNEILKEECTKDKVDLLAEKFEEIAYKKIMNCPFVPGALEFLQDNYAEIDFYIASGTPQEELIRILKGRNISHLFVGAYGTPAKKEEIIEVILNEKKYHREEVLFVGDAGTDKRAAYKTGLTFVGRNTESNTVEFSDVKYRVDDIRDIKLICNSFGEIK